jgi:hypothetical protein
MNWSLSFRDEELKLTLLLLQRQLHLVRVLWQSENVFELIPFI